MGTVIMFILRFRLGLRLNRMATFMITGIHVIARGIFAVVPQSFSLGE